MGACELLRLNCGSFFLACLKLGRLVGDIIAEFCILVHVKFGLCDVELVFASLEAAVDTLKLVLIHYIETQLVKVFK